jgi:Tol biopolymer transport system component
MTDHELEQRLRSWYRAEIPIDEAAPPALRSKVATIPRDARAPLDRIRSSRGFRLLAVAAILTATLVGGALLAGSTVERPPSVVQPSDRPALGPPAASPDPSPLSTPSASLEACLTDTVQVLTGDALPPVDGDGLVGLGRSRGVYLAGRPPILWAANPGQDSSTPIASFSPETPGILDVVDISPDGSTALIRVGNIGPQGLTPECADLYLVWTDGSGANRLTRFGTGRFVTGAAFSPDGRRVAYTWWAPDTVTTLDLETGATVDQVCRMVYGSSPTRIEWSPTGDSFAIGCDSTLTVFDASATTPPATFRMAEEPPGFTWTNDRMLIVASGGGNIYTFEVPSQTSTVVRQYGDDPFEIVGRSGVFSPDGRWLAYTDTEGVPEWVGYLVPIPAGTPTRIPGEIRDPWAWSEDSRSLVYITGQDFDLVLVRLNIETLQPSTVGTITNRQGFPLNYRQGIWRVQ